MRFNKQLTILLIIITTVTVVIMIGAIQISRQSKYTFATYDDIERAGHFDKGWLPDFLPKSSKHITESHDRESKEVKAIFKYSPNDTKSVEQACFDKKNVENGIAYRCTFGNNQLIIVLLNSGEGYLHSAPNPE